MFWKKASPYFAPSRGALNDVMKKLYNTYEACGGEKYNQEEDTQGLSPFDALKIFVCEKMRLCRKAIKELRAIKDRRSQTYKKRDIRHMLSFIEKDYEKMQRIYTTNASPKKFMMISRKVDEKLVESQRGDLSLIGRHIDEIQKLYKARFKNEKSGKGSGRGKKKGKKGRRGKHNDLFGEDSEEEKEERGDDVDMSGIVVEDNSDPTQSSLPKINISAQMSKVKRNKDTLKQGLQQFNQKLALLKEQALTMSDQIDEGSKIMEEVEYKVDKNQSELDKLNKTTEKAKEKIKGQTKLLVVIILMIALIVAIIVIYVVLVSTGLLKNPVTIKI